MTQLFEVYALRRVGGDVKTGDIFLLTLQKCDLFDIFLLNSHENWYDVKQ